MSLAAFGVRKPVVVNLLMFGLLLGGVFFGMGIRREFFPETDPTQVVITAPYPGAAPDEVERSLATKIEDKLRDLRDVKEITATVSEGVATVRVEFESGKNIDAAVAEVKRDIDALQDLPDAADRIIITKLEPNLPAIVLSLYGDGDERAMKRAIRQIRDDLRTLPGMGQVVVSGSRTDEIDVEVRPEAALKHRLSLPAISDRIRASMIEQPGGAVRSPTENIGIRTPGADETAEDVSNIVVKAGDDGQLVRVRDVADVTHGFVDVDLRTRLNGKPAVSLTVYKVGKQDAVSMADLVKSYAAGLQGQAPRPTVFQRLGNVISPRSAAAKKRAYELGEQRRSVGELPGKVALTTDLARFIVGRLQLLTRNALQGSVVVFITLFLFLNWRVSFWVLAGMVVALMGTLIMMRISGITLNLLTMFGLIIVVGILVDDGIVIAENIVARHERGESPVTAAIRGANQVGWPVVGTVLTTIFAFLPLALIKGRMGDLLGDLPIVVAVALAASLVEALFILPSHMSHTLEGVDRREASHHQSRFERLEQRFDQVRDHFFANLLLPAYTRLLRVCLGHPYLSVAVGIATVTISIGMVAGGKVGYAFLTSSDAETINGELRMPVGTPASVTDEYVRRVEQAAIQIPEIKSVFAIVGAVSSLEGDGGAAAPHLAQIVLELTSVEDRTAKGQDSSDKVVVRLRDALAGKLVGVKSFRLEEIQGGGSGPPIAIGVVGDNIQTVEAAANEIMKRLDAFEGVYDVADDAESGQQELRFHLRDGATELGFTTATIASQVRGAVFGLEPYTFAGDEEDVDIRVRYPEAFRRNLAALEAMHVFTPSGTPVPLPEVVRVEQARAYATVRRIDGRRAVTVTADADTRRISPEEITGKILAERDQLERQFPGVKIVERGRSKDQKESLANLPLGFLTALALIYVCLAWLFQSYTQPILVLTAVPFAIIGVIWGHYLLGYRLTFLSMIGFIALAGIVVNDSIIFVEFFNHMRKAGLTSYAACVASGRARLRAILLTTITTAGGLAPMLLEQSFQARFLIPMAITISFGLMSSTVLVLVLLPSLLMILADVKRVIAMLWRGVYIEPEARTEPESLDAFIDAEETAQINAT
ncbi:MAG: efflux RND transporter permease subunit [Phycisphaerales bacterium]|nr:efflux RND transporter permease subunit [Phycisphaerales bacterium]